ncbi:MAG: ribbon-helix-helix domain-containing protein [Alphaproteobacteria bacterium]|nr:ribbon-helix-helix domain-containing protein [Alphaproteobacteria bacterium]MCB9974797.1 ribbon-helix-helix domain-containing protein [Rhodospirillales bacterium]
MGLLSDKSPGSRKDDEGRSRRAAKSTLVSRNITVYGRRTSIRLEPEMWDSLQAVARNEKCTIHNLCTLVDLRKDRDTSLTAAIRVFLMLYFRAAATEEGHMLAGHGSFERMKLRARITDEMGEYFNSGRGGASKRDKESESKKIKVA